MKIKGGFGHGSPKMFYSDQDVWIHKFTCKQFLVSKVKEGWTEQDSNIIWLSFRVNSFLASSSSGGREQIISIEYKLYELKIGLIRVGFWVN